MAKIFKKSNEKSNTLNLSSTRNKIILFTLIFAIAGGTWLVLSTYAASRVHTCVPSSCLLGRTDGRTAFRINILTKGGASYWALKRDGEAYTSPRPVMLGKRYNVCATVKGSGSFYIDARTKNGAATSVGFSAGSSYATRCIGYTVINGDHSSTGIAGFKDLTAKVKSTSSSDIHVSTIFIDVL